jgi:diguanylate cyclase (GGDEF)-like protein/PAS domain S-box-containing protein
MSPTEIDNPRQNRILAALPTHEFARLLDDLEMVTLALDQVLYEPGDYLRHVHFPTTSIVSLVSTTESGASAELAIAGNDGLVGTPLILGGDNTNHRAVVQSAGKAYRLKAEIIRWELQQGGRLQQLALRYTQALMTQMAQSIVCNRHHTVDQQLCRWLLLSLDRLSGNQLDMTQELIANMLGVRREAVTEAAGKLQAADLIQYRRGHITVIDRPGLEARACECYKVVKRELDRLILVPPAPATAVPRTRPSPATLRQRAEARLQQTAVALLPAPPENAERLVHELQVHQVELEMHNEELRHAYEEADAFRTRYADIYDFAPIGYVTIDARGTILDLNLAGAILLGIKRSQKGRERFAASVKPDYLPLFNRFVETALTAKNKAVCEIALLPTGQRPETLVRIEAVHDEAGQECRMVLIDISSEKQAEKAILERALYQRALLDNFPFVVWLKDKESGFLAVNTPFAPNSEELSAAALEENERRYRSFIGNIPLGIAIAQDGVLKYINPKAAELMDDTPEECVGEAFLSLFFEADRPIATEALRARLAGETLPPECDVRVISKQGRLIDCRMHLSIVAWEGRIAAMAIFENLTERQMAEADLRRLAATDPLTELDNRRHFMDHMARALARMRRDVGQLTAVLLLDVDHFKAINDSLGHAAGDATLRFLAGLLRDELRREDTAGRIGGDEFAILLPGSDLASAAIFAERLRKLIAETRVNFGSQQVAITVSIGVSILEATDSTNEQALARADEALYRAKAAGRNRIELTSSLAANIDPPGHGLTAPASESPPPVRH